MSLSLTDAVGNPTTTLVAGQPLTATASVYDDAGNPVSGAVVTFSSDTQIAVLTPTTGTALTDGFGVARVQMAIASAATDGGAGTLTAKVTVGTETPEAKVGFSVSALGSGGSSASLGIALANASGAPTTNLTTGDTLTATARLLDASGKPMAGVLVTFRSNSALVSIIPSAGTALTDAAGIAKVQVTSASPTAAGAGTLIAEAPVGGLSVQGAINYIVSGGGAGVPSLGLSLLDGAGAASTNLAAGRPLTASAQVRDGSGRPVPGLVVTFSTNASLAKFSPASGTALTDSAGVAKVQVLAASIDAAGAAVMNASVAVGGVSADGSVSYAVSPGAVTLLPLVISSNSIQAYGTTAISVEVQVDGKLSETPISVTFTSGCAASGKASLPSVVQTVGGKAVATYTDKGCAGTDSITASAQGANSVGGSIVVAAPTAANLQYISSLPATIYLKGTGLVEVSTVTFKLVDATGQAVAGRDIELDLDTRTGGVKLDGGDVAVVKKTAADGSVSVTVAAGSNPTPVLVKAKLVGSTLSSQSNRLTISTGLPTQDSFSLSVGSPNIEGWVHDGVSTPVSIIASDRLGNPVPNGTTINFIVEGAQVSPSNCATTDGRCSVAFISAERRPTSDSEPSGRVTKGRVTLLAYTLGEESFGDRNGNNLFDAGSEGYSDLGDVFIDANESGNYASGEQFVPYGASGLCAAPGSDGNYGDVLSKPATCDGVWGRAHVRRHVVMILSGSKAMITGGPYSMSGCGPTSFDLMLYDENGNPMPAGTTLSATGNFVKFAQIGSPDPQTATLDIVNNTVLDSSAVGGTKHTFSVYAEKCASAPSGTFSLNVKTPKGIVTPIEIRIN
ncbi:Ig-like domain-containing protein [Niveibacterium sp. 24ML]|uniref:Ig-like domain-containing protein n=1 Tax=Niveibacterium sp. 24ML TaxID=2985512 RepID=UPI0022702B8F|nr:Ig-like domain-containing protein [Niveibacterium sp. 24ML]